MARRGNGAEARRALAILRLAEGWTVSEVARLVEAARSSVYRWVGRYQCHGVQGLVMSRGGRSPFSVTDEVVALVMKLVDESPRSHGYQRSTWTTALLAEAVNEHLGTCLHASTIRRLLPRLGFGWRRARPTLCRRDPQKAERLAAIAQALAHRRPDVAVCYVDEADIDLNPRIGFLWTPRGRQHAIPTPGCNEKSYLAGSLDAHTGEVLWVAGPSKSSRLFIALLEVLAERYRRAREIVLILDNYIIHKSRLTRQWLARHGRRFRLLFQPAYHPWVNRIERLWKQLHDTVTRNHRYANMAQLMHAVHEFLTSHQPFPRHASV